MIFKSTPVHLTHFGMIAKPVSDLLTIFAMPLHSYVQGLDTTKHQETIHWTWNCTTAFLNKIKLLSQVSIIHHQRTLYNIAVTAKIFCSRMHYDISTKIQRILCIRSSKSIVYAKEDIMFFGDGSNCSY